MNENDKKLLQLYKKDIRKKRIIVFLLILIFIGGCSLYYFYIDLKQSTKESNSDNKEITSNNIELKDTNEEENINVTNENKSQKTDESKITETTVNKEKTEEIQGQTNKDTNLEKKKIIIGILLITVLSILSFFTLRVYANSQEKVEGIYLDNNLIENEKIIKKDLANKTIELDSKAINLKYEYTLKNSTKEIDMFVDTENTEYMVIEDNIIGFIKDIDSENKNVNATKVTTATKTQGQILDIAINYLSKNIENFNEYTLLSISYIDSYNEYSITYMNKCNGYNTFDTAQINITPSGEIVSYCANNQGIMKEYEDSNFIVDQMENMEFIEDTLNSEFTDINKYEIEDKILTKINNKLAIQYYISIELENSYNDSAVIICYVD